MAKRLRSPVTRSQVAVLAIREFLSRGGRLAEIKKRLRLPSDVESRSELVLSVAEVRELLDALAEKLGDPLFGVRLARRLVDDPQAWGDLLGYLSRSAPTVRDFLTATERFFPLRSEVISSRLTQKNGAWVFEGYIEGEPLALGRHGNEWLLGMALFSLRNRLGKPFVPERAWLAHPAPQEPAPLLRELEVRSLQYNAGRVGFELPARLLDQPLPGAEPRLYALLFDYGERLLEEGKGGSRLLSTVRKALYESFESHTPGLQAVARSLGTSVRSLQRRLKEEGTSFDELLQSVREELARNLLRDVRRSISEVAFALHYQEPSAFVRAFRRWTGQTPGAFRGAKKKRASRRARS